MYKAIFLIILVASLGKSIAYAQSYSTEISKDNKEKILIHSD